ncbi:hypothetical protein BD779DRAFT_1478893 [Infundibulicybe gibba]|nr:hypothetical protein BD779DRAFT_1478893 [Infundibulicybe gibba]
MSESICPRRTNANTDPTKILREYGQKRRTNTQIALDNAQEAATVAKKAEKNRLEHERKAGALLSLPLVQEVSKFEDKLSQEDKVNELTSSEMDPANASVSANDSDSSDPIQDDTINISEESVIDIESSDGLPALGFDNDSDHVDYEDDGLENPAASMMGSQLPSMDDGYYAQHTQSDSDTLSDSHVIPMKAVRKIKAKRGALRSEIYQAREEPPKAGAAPLGQQRMEAAAHKNVNSRSLQTPNQSTSKRPKTSKPSGLLSNWKKLIPGDAVGKQLSNKSSKSEKGTHNDADECVRGELDEDEPDETILAVRSMKGGPSAPAIKIRHAGISQVNVHVVKIEGDNTEEAGNRGNRGRTKKVKYMVSSLPFPGGAEGSAYFKKYRKIFKPTLIAWASTLDDPFGANSLIEPTIRELWALIFPKINYLDPNDKKWRPIDSIASEALTNWRSDLGKEALKIVKRFLLANVLKDDIPSFIDQMRDGPPKFRFIYGDPQQKASYSITP